MNVCNLSSFSSAPLTTKRGDRIRSNLILETINPFLSPFTFQNERLVESGTRLEAVVGFRDAKNPIEQSPGCQGIAQAYEAKKLRLLKILFPISFFLFFPPLPSIHRTLFN